jgi:hypothetical protein
MVSPRNRNESGYMAESMVLLFTSPFLGVRGRLKQLGWLRGRRDPLEVR